MSWFRVEADGHERRRVWLLAEVGKVDRQTAIDDLRMWQDRIMAPGSSVQMPSSKDFGERWGWPKTTAYRLLVDFESWSDPYRLDAWREIWNARGTDAERSRNGAGTKLNEPNPTTNRARNETGTRTERERNESGHTRGIARGSLSPSPSPSQDPPLTPPAGGAGPGDPVELVRVVVAAVAEAHADDSDLLALVEVVGGDRLAIERERRAEQQRQREQVWAHAACGDPQLAAEVYARARPQLAALGVRRVRAVEELLVQASGMRPTGMQEGG